MLLAAGVPAEEILQQLPPREVNSGHGAEEILQQLPPREVNSGHGGEEILQQLPAAAAPPSAAAPPLAAPPAPAAPAAAPAAALPASGGDNQRTQAETPRAILALKKTALERKRACDVPGALAALKEAKRLEAQLEAFSIGAHGLGLG